MLKNLKVHLGKIISIDFIERWRPRMDSKYGPRLKIGNHALDKKANTSSLFYQVYY